MKPGYNKDNDEYLELLEEKNRLKRQMESSREHQIKKKIEEREKGFNVYISGPNEARVKE